MKKFFDIFFKIIAGFLTSLGVIVWFASFHWICAFDEFQCGFYNLGLLAIICAILYLFIANKKGWLILMTSFFFFVFLFWAAEISPDLNKMSCFDTGGCWDYSVNACEYHDQCKCTPDTPECQK